MDNKNNKLTELKKHLPKIVIKALLITAVSFAILIVTLLISFAYIQNFIVMIVALLAGGALSVIAAYFITGYKEQFPSRTHHRLFTLGYCIFAGIFISLGWRVFESIYYDDTIVAKRHYSQAQEIITYGSEEYDSVMHTPAVKNSILIDYDHLSIDFIYKDDMGADFLKDCTLRESLHFDIDPENDPIQFETPLSSPGKKLTLYSFDNGTIVNPEHTLYARVTMEDGQELYASVNEYLFIK